MDPASSILPSSPPVPPDGANVPVEANTTLDTCWSRIGIRGDGSCPELPQHVHCRNCPVHARAGALLLNRPLPADYRREWRAHFAGAQRRAAPAASGPERPLARRDTSVTIFRLGPEWLALDTALLQEVTERRPLHSVPHRRLGVVLGLANVRGELLLCISLSRLIGLKYDIPRERLRPPARSGLRPGGQEQLRLVVVSADANRFAFPADEVHGVYRFNREELREPPATVAHAPRSFTRGVFHWRPPARSASGPEADHTVGYLDNEAVCFHLSRSLT